MRKVFCAAVAATVMLSGAALIGQGYSDSMNPPPSNMPSSAMPQGTNGSASKVVATEIQWNTNFQEAVAKAKRGNKPLFVYFTGSDWCGWCKKLDASVLSNKEFVSRVADRFVFVLVDFPSSVQLSAELKQQNEELKTRFGVTAYPTILILSPDGTTVLAETGVRQEVGAAYADHLFSLLR